MSDTKISAMPVASALTGTESVPLLQGGLNKKVPSIRILEPLLQTRTDTAVPHVGVNMTAVPESILVLTSDNVRDGDAIGNVIQIFRTITASPVGDANQLRNGIRSLTTVSPGVSNVNAIWGISGEVVLGAGSTSGSGIGGATAVSGVVAKHAAGYSAISGHFQVVDDVSYATPGDVTPSVACEMNIKAIGLDDPAANDTAGNRVVHTLYARGANDSQPNEIGTGILLRHTNSGGDGGKGYFRFGMYISDQMTTDGHHAMDTALRIDTNGRYGVWMVGAGHSIADVYLNAPSAYGLVCGGTYSSGLAIRVPAGAGIGFSTDAATYIKKNAGTGALEFWINGALCAHLNPGTADHAL